MQKKPVWGKKSEFYHGLEEKMETALAGLVKYGRDSRESNKGKITTKPQQNMFPPDPSEEP